MNIENSKKEILYMNYVKAFAIIAMVLGHANSPINIYIYQYHMALFMFVSGYFYKEMYSKQPHKLFLSRIKTLWLPFLIYNIVFLFFVGVLSNTDVISFSISLANINTYKAFLKKIVLFNSYVPYLGAFWFVKTLFLTNIAYSLISFISFKINNRYKNVIRNTILLLMFFVCWFLLKGNIHVSKNFIQVPMALMIFALGNYFRIYESKIKFKLYYALIALFLLITNAQFGIVDMDSLTYTSPSFYIVSSMLGIYVNIYFAKLLQYKTKKIWLLDKIGKSTYCVLAFHLLIKDILIKILGEGLVNKGWFSWIYAIIAILLSVLIQVIISFVKVKTKLLCNMIRNR